MSVPFAASVLIQESPPHRVNSASLPSSCLLQGLLRPHCMQLGGAQAASAVLATAQWWLLGPSALCEAAAPGTHPPVWSARARCSIDYHLLCARHRHTFAGGVMTLDCLRASNNTASVLRSCACGWHRNTMLVLFMCCVTLLAELSPPQPPTPLDSLREYWWFPSNAAFGRRTERATLPRDDPFSDAGCLPVHTICRPRRPAFQDFVGSGHAASQCMNSPGTVNMMRPCLMECSASAQVQI
jgi:hypothetical protein